MTDTPRAAPALGLLSFRLGADDYAVDVGRVRQIVPFAGAAWLPGFAPAVRGAVEVHGKAIAAVDLAAALGLASSPPTAESCLLIVETGGTHEDAVVGLIVDAPRDLLELDEPTGPPDTRRAHEAQAGPLGSVRSHDGVEVRVIDLDRLLEANPSVRGAGRGAASRPVREVMSPAAEPLLVCTAGGLWFALPVLGVERIVLLSDAAPVPGAPPALHGLMPGEGEPIAVLDPAVLFGREATLPPADACVLIAREEGGNGALARALLVDGIERELEVGEGDVVAPPRGAWFAAEWIAGLVRIDEGLVAVLDLPVLLGCPAARAAVTAAGNVPQGTGREKPARRRR